MTPSGSCLTGTRHPSTTTCSGARRLVGGRGPYRGGVPAGVAPPGEVVFDGDSALPWLLGVARQLARNATRSRQRYLAALSRVTARRSPATSKPTRPTWSADVLTASSSCATARRHRRAAAATAGSDRAMRLFRARSAGRGRGAGRRGRHGQEPAAPRAAATSTSTCSVRRSPVPQPAGRTVNPIDELAPCCRRAPRQGTAAAGAAQGRAAGRGRGRRDGWPAEADPRGRPLAVADACRRPSPLSSWRC